VILADTGFFVAVADRRDRWHGHALACLPLAESEGLATTWPVLAESCYLLATRLGSEFAARLIEDALSSAITVWNPNEEATAQIPTLLRKYAKLPMDLADASLVLLAEHLGHGRILTTDTRDFGAYRWKSRKPFKNVLQEMKP